MNQLQGRAQMLKLVSPLLVIVIAAAQPALARPAIASYGPPSLKSSSFPSDLMARETFGDAIDYPSSDNLLTANGVEIADGGARRPIAPNTELAVEPARGLVNEFGRTKKPMRLLLRVGTSF